MGVRALCRIKPYSTFPDTKNSADHCFRRLKRACGILLCQEFRLLFIIINTLLILFGKTYLAGALPYALVLSTFGLWYVMFKTQQRLWKLDKG